jgi:hypothetical protein
MHGENISNVYNQLIMWAINMRLYKENPHELHMEDAGRTGVYMSM